MITGTNAAQPARHDQNSANLPSTMVCTHIVNDCTTLFETQIISKTCRTTRRPSEAALPADRLAPHCALTMRRQRVATGFLHTALQMATTDATSGYYASALDIVYDVCACVLALLAGAALMKLLRDYTRRKGYIEIQQDDRGMYSNVLMGTSDSWENVRVADVKKEDEAAI
jgi:hypothetical protein